MRNKPCRKDHPDATWFSISTRKAQCVEGPQEAGETRVRWPMTSRALPHLVNAIAPPTRATLLVSDEWVMLAVPLSTMQRAPPAKARTWSEREPTVSGSQQAVCVRQ